MHTRSGRPTTAKKVPRGSLEKRSATKVPIQAQKSQRTGSSKNTSPVIQDESSLETVPLPRQAKRSVSLAIAQRRRLLNAKELSAPSQIKKLTTKHCCKLNCFQKVDRDQLCDDMKKVAHMNQKDRRHFLQSLFVQKFETYRYGGRRVCYEFLNQTFRFSVYMQWKTKMKLIGAPASRPVESPDSELGSTSDSEKQPEIDEQDQLRPEEADDMVNIDEQDQLRPEESNDMVNTFVAVKGTGCSAEEPFWLAKVKGVERGKRKEIYSRSQLNGRKKRMETL